MIDERSPDARSRDARLYAHEVRQIVPATTETLAGRDYLPIRYCLVVIGGALNKVPNEVLAGEPEIPWRSIIGLRHRLVHAYWLIDPGIISEIARNETAALIAALDRLIAGIKP
jgi:uncharacterized protein with HEPN domain